jgi:hypothetical protein
MMHARDGGRRTVRFLVAAAAALGSLAAMAGPAVSIPSTPDTDGRINVRGNGVAAYSNVTVRITHDQLSPIDLVAQAGANGSFVVKFEPQITGAYAVAVFDSSGNQIGTGRFGHFR